MKKNKLKTFLKESNILISVIFLVLGIILFTNPDIIKDIVLNVLGVILILVGTFKILLYYKQDNGKKTQVLRGLILILVGAFSIISGLVFINTVEKVLKIIVGCFLIYIGIIRLITAFKVSKELKLTYIINGGLIILVGIILPFIQGFKIIGLFIICYSLIEIISFIICKIKSPNDVFEAVIEEKETVKEEVKVIEVKDETKLLNEKNN